VVVTEVTVQSTVQRQDIENGEKKTVRGREA
jgi:hypothetical protein